MGGRYVIEDFNLFGGLHCETSAVRKVYLYNGLDVSEEMLFGLAGGISFMYWFMKQMPFPMIGGRGGGRYFIENIAERTGAAVDQLRTGSSMRAHVRLVERLAAGQPTVIYCDMAYLPYMGIAEGAHFGQHVIVVCGIDEDEDLVYISDRCRRGVTVTVADLRKARGSKFPPFPAQNVLFDVRLPRRLEITRKAVRQALQGCVDGLVNPPISNFGLEGIQKWAKLILKWPEMFQGISLWGALLNGFIFIETGGTGGGCFRPIFSRFLAEVEGMLNLPKLGSVMELYQESGRIWSEIAESMLPDSYPALRRAREILWEKDRVFLAQEPDATEKLLELNHELDEMQDAILAEVGEAPEFLPAVQKQILRLYQVEKEAIQLLDSMVT